MPTQMPYGEGGREGVWAGLVRPSDNYLLCELIARIRENQSMRESNPSVVQDILTYTYTYTYTHTHPPILVLRKRR